MSHVVGNTDGVQTVMAVEDGSLITGTTQDCTPYLERATAMRNEGITGSSEMRLAASFPDVLVERYCNQQGIEFSEFMQNPVHIKRMCADPDLSGFRIWTGKV